MDLLVSTVVAFIFGSIGAGIIWLFKKGKKPYKEILAYQSTASDIIGVIVAIAIGTTIYFLNK